METIFFLFLRRMRQPLLTLIVVYAVAVLVLTLIPGQKPTGEVWHMDIFHALYFVSFMATTIGFGEVPYPFSDAQRLWVMISMHATVVAWIYALGTILALLQDKTFQRAIAERSFARRIRGMRESFYLICGYGETGQTLVRALTDRGQHAVVIDQDAQRTNLIQLQNLRDYVPALDADAREPRYLEKAGLPHPRCAAVVAVTDDNETNLKIAITSKLLHSNIRVICRADSADIEANMASFGTDYIIDPFQAFSDHLDVAVRSPCLYLLQQWLGGERDQALAEPIYPPTSGHWIVCGFGRFGKSMVDRLQSTGMQVTVIEREPEQTGEPPEGYVVGRGTEAETLRAANIESAVGIIAATDDDTNNLSIVMTARDLRPDLFVILRQNHTENQSLIDAVEADMVMHPSAIIAERIRNLLATPMLYRFAAKALSHDDEWACELISRISALVNTRVPDIQEIQLDDKHAAALCELDDRGEAVTIDQVLRDPWNRERRLPYIVLLVERGGKSMILPEEGVSLQRNDRILLCGNGALSARLHWNLSLRSALDYVRGTQISAGGWLWRRFKS